MQEQVSTKIGDLTISAPKALLVEALLQQAFASSKAVAKVEPDIANVPEIGDRWIGQGGYYVGVIRGRDGLPSHHVVVAPPDSDGADLEWGGRGTDIPDARSGWNGRANTVALINSSGPHPAAKHAAGYSCEGHNDYHLGSHAEMGIAWANAPELFEKAWYWTSSQYSADVAWDQSFGDGLQGNVGKYSEGRVRPVRWIPVK